MLARAVTPRPPKEPGEEVASACDPSPPLLCTSITVAPGPEEVLYFRQAVPIVDIPIDLGIEPGTPKLQIACVRVLDANAQLGLDLHYEQRWYFRRQVLGSVSASLSLAPAETLSITLRNTQRKQFEQTTIDEVEQTESTESTIVDKDVLNVTRSSSRSNNWTVSGNGSINLPKFSLGASGSVSETVNQAASSSAERTREGTSKSAANLKVLHKVQVREFREEVQENVYSRRISNPYRDRSLRLDVFEIAKDYCTEFALSRMEPALVVELVSIQFDRAFVRANGAFLQDSLLDNVLRFELPRALEAVVDLPHDETVAGKAERLSLLALDYLFAGPAMFNLAAVDVPDVGSVDPNLPATSFDSSLMVPLIGTTSGLTESIESHLGVILTTLGFYYHVYRGHVLPVVGGALSNGALALDLALSLEGMLSPRWLGVEETDQVGNVLNTQDFTEVFRRLGGFLGLVGGVIRPLVQPMEAERAASEASRRAEFVVQRTLDHLNCHARLYTQRFLEWVAARTRMRAVYAFAEELLLNNLAITAPVRDDLTSLLDVTMAFIDGNHIVVPAKQPLDEGAASRLFQDLDAEDNEPVPLGILDVTDVRVPTDGVHIEPAAGSCILADVPEGPLAGPIHVSVSQEPT